MARVLTIGAHCDDVELGMGGTLLIHKDRGDELFVAVLFSDDEYAGNVHDRSMEQRASLDILQAEIKAFYTGIPMKEIVKELDKIKPDLLYFPYEIDYHQEHRFTSEVGLAMSRNIGMSVLKYITITSYDYYPNYLQSIDMERKGELVNCFKSQMERRPDIFKRMLAQDKFFGSLIPNDGEYAEGFVFHRMIAKHERKVLHE